MLGKLGKRAYGAINVLAVLAAVITIAGFFIVQKNSHLEDTSVNFGSMQDFCGGWFYEEDGQTIPAEELPYIAPDNAVTFRHTLPDSAGEPMVLSFPNRQQKVTVWVGEECVYRYGGSGPLRGLLLPSIQCFVPVGIQDGTAAVEIKLENRISRKTVLPEIRIGSQGAVLMGFMKNSWGILLFGVLMISFSLALIGGSIVLRRKSRSAEFSLLLSAGIFILLSSLWVFTDSPVMQLITGKSEAVFIVSFLCFMTFPIPMFSFVDSVCETKYTGIMVLKLLFFLNFFVQVFLYGVLGIDFYKMLTVTHILILAAIILIIYYLVKEYRSNRSYYAKEILFAIFIFMATTLLSYIDFYGKRVDYSVFMRLGLLAYALILITISLRKLILSGEERTKLDIYKSLAYVDIMTGCHNRAAFEKEMEALKEEGRQSDLAGMAMLDLNGLKKVNDTFGHSIGDEVIIGAGSCIEKAFEGLGDCFRIGGDEFLVILRGRKLQEKEYRKRLEETILSYNKEHEMQVHLSCGFALTGDGLKDADSLYGEADSNMYLQKQKIGKTENRENRK